MSADQFFLKKSGQLPSGFGMEVPNSRFRGGAIFNDATTGIIWVENQIYLGADETVMVKPRFDEWLW